MPTLEELTQAARLVGKKLSREYNLVSVAAYPDEKNGRICINIYPAGEESEKRLAGQVKTNKATIFHRGQIVTQGE